MVLDLRRLRLLHELHRRGTVGAVAGALSYSASTVSQQLRVLEREAGAKLFEPAGRRVRLTDAGLALAAHAETLLDGVERAETDVAAIAAGAAIGTVRVGSFQTASMHLLLPAMLVLRETHPAVGVELWEFEPEPALDALRSHRLDLVLADEWTGAPRSHHAGVDRRDLLTEAVLLVADRPVELHELADAEWVTGTPGGGMEAFTRRVCNGLAGFEPRIRHRTNELSMLLALAAAGEAVALLPELALKGADHVVARPIDGLTRTVFTATRSGAAKRPAIEAVATALSCEVSNARSASNEVPRRR